MLSSRQLFFPTIALTACLISRLTQRPSADAHAEAESQQQEYACSRVAGAPVRLQPATPTGVCLHHHHNMLS
jgi:hypothetical protein